MVLERPAEHGGAGEVQAAAQHQLRAAENLLLLQRGASKPERERYYLSAPGNGCFVAERPTCGCLGKVDASSVGSGPWQFCPPHPSLVIALSSSTEDGLTFFRVCDKKRFGCLKGLRHTRAVVAQMTRPHITVTFSLWAFC